MKVVLNGEYDRLGKVCLLLDILIDCENYRLFDAEIRNLTKYSINLSSFTLNAYVRSIDIDIIVYLESKIADIDGIDATTDIDYFNILVMSKFIRRYIKENERILETDKVRPLFKALTEKLLKKIPEFNATKELYNISNQIRIIFLNEISACCESDLAIGFAKMALDELKELNKAWNLRNSDERIRHPYELYALYNEGLSYLHNQKDPDHSIEILSQITNLFEDKSNISNNNSFFKEYVNMKDFYPICFWLFYVPSKYLVAEAYGDSFSSSNLEKTVDDTFKNIDYNQGSADICDSSGNNITKFINDYNSCKLYLQLIISAVDKQDKKVFDDKDIDEKDKLNLLTKFGKSGSKLSQIFNKRGNTYLSASSIKIQLLSAKCLFLLEHVQHLVNKKRKTKCIEEIFRICKKHLIAKCGTDWSDFACTYLECAIYVLENDGLRVPKNFNDIYKYILEIIVNKDAWIARRKELIENLLKYQDMKLNEDKENGDKKSEFIFYQIQIIKNVVGLDSENKFQRKWPDCEKEKLIKNLKERINNEGSKTVTEWLQNHYHKKRVTNKIKKNDIDFAEKMDNDYIMPDQKDIEQIATFIQNNINCDYYTKYLRLNTEQFNDHLIYQSRRPALTNSYMLTVLRRWQSFTPTLAMGSEVGHKGGGYFVYKTNQKGEIEEGLVIDPGFDFLDNFFEEGFSIRDISGILITHSHRDHASDFMSIVTLIHEMNEKRKRIYKKENKRKLLLWIAEGGHQFYAEQIKRYRESFKNVMRIKVEKLPDTDELTYFKVEAKEAKHYDQSDHDSVGYVIKNKRGHSLIGFTGDTRWYSGIEEKYNKCPVVCMNLGGVIDLFKKPELKLSDLCIKNNLGKYEENIKKILLRENHLYLPGFYLMAKKLDKKRQKLIILSEICEEMKGGLRTDITKKMTEDLGITVLPEDIGLTVILKNEKKKKNKYREGYVVCRVCNEPRDNKKNNIVAVETKRDNAIIYLCKKHYDKLKEENVISDISELKMDDNEIRNKITP